MLDQTQANSIKVKENIIQPGLLRFIRFWATSSQHIQSTKIMYELLQRNKTLLEELVSKGVVDKSTMHNKGSFIQLECIDGIDVAKDC